jgi:CheY-like chemotaxis protein
VDDDRISRHAVSCAAKKAFDQPDLAENGEAALILASEHPYDVIFMDVQMPGMDGFELCSKIHATECNCATPVVFVTCQSDFSARVESTLCGGNDLIAKPFLTFEITVKALTLALHRRLHANDPIADASNGSAGSEGLSSSLPEPVGLVVSGLRGASPATLSGDSFFPGRSAIQECPRNGEDPHPPEFHPPLPSGLSSNAHADAFFTRAPAHVGALRDCIREMSENANADVREDRGTDLLLRIHSLTLNADLAGLRPVFQLSAALEGLVKKLLERSGHLTGPALQTVAAAAELLNDLCVKGVKMDRVANPPVRILVVDDDLIARRAIAGALQMSFKKPDLAENGESALLLAAEKSYDVIFLDVLMPGMDGFTVCSRIHETTANSHTPVVLVTSYTDPKCLSQCALCGASDITTKPFLKAEITVKALTFTLRHRLEKLKTAGEFIPEQHESGTIESCPA